MKTQESRPVRTLAFSALLALAGCTVGTVFERPPEGALVLGETTMEEALSMLGAPLGRGSTVQNGHTLETISYAYRPAIGAARETGAYVIRTLGLAFADGRLVSHVFMSTGSEDHTDFDESRVKEIREGTTTETEVIQLLGPPSGRCIHPVVSDPKGRGLIYSYAVHGYKRHVNKSLHVELSPEGAVKKVAFNVQEAK